LLVLLLRKGLLQDVRHLTLNEILERNSKDAGERERTYSFFEEFSMTFH
jgi:hypothetical protein